MVSLSLLWNHVTFGEVLIAVTAYLLTRLLMYKFNKRRLRMPGPFPWPVIGNVLILAANPQEAFRKLGKRYGGIYQVKLGSVSVVVLAKYDVIKEALIRKKSTFSGRPLFQSFSNISFGQGVAFNGPATQGDEWIKNKTIIQKYLHAFATSIHTRARFSDHVRKEMVELIKHITKQAEKTPDGFVHPEEMVNVAIANVICALAYGQRYDHDNEEFLELLRFTRVFGDVVGSGSQADTMPWIKIFPYYKKIIDIFNEAMKRTNDWNLRRTKEHSATYDKMKDIVDGLTYTFNKSGDNAAGEKKVASLATDIFGATQDTMSAAIQWIMLYLIKYPEHQKKIRDEVEDFMTDNDTYPSIPPRNSLPNAEAFIHEIFRHSSFIASTLPHCTLADTELRGYKIPEGTVVFVSQDSANHDPELWDEPDEFKPERFLDENGKIVRKAVDSYTIFSFGERQCPGKDLATLWMRYFLVLFVHLCEVEQDPKRPPSHRCYGNLSRRPKLRLRLKVRNPDLLRKISEEDGPVTKKAQFESRGATLANGNGQNGHIAKTNRSKSYQKQEKPSDTTGFRVTTGISSIADSSGIRDSIDLDDCNGYRGSYLSSELKTTKLFRDVDAKYKSCNNNNSNTCNLFNSPLGVKETVDPKSLKNCGVFEIVGAHDHRSQSDVSQCLSKTLYI